MLVRRSLSEDSLDRFNHTWAVLFLLLLSFVTWLIPLASLGQPKGTTSPTPTGAATYKSNCWCPAQFTDNQVQYTNTICQRAYNDYVRGVQPANSSYHIEQFESEYLDLPRPKGPAPRSKYISRRPEQKSPSYLHVQIPLSLFILAACLKIPYVVWKMVTFWSKLNSHNIIQAIKDGLTGDAATRQQMNKELMSAPSSSSISSGLAGCSNTVLYLSIKALVCAVFIVEMLYTLVFLLQKSDSEQTVLDEDSKTPVACIFKIRQLQMVHEYTVQCFMSRTEPVLSESGDTLQQMYHCLCVILVVFLCVAAILNLLNLIGWILKLTVMRGQLTEKSNVSLDDRLLLIMAANNAGYLTARDLEQAIDDSAGKEPPAEENNEPTPTVITEKEGLALQEVQAES